MIIFCQKEKAVKRLPTIYNIEADDEMLRRLGAAFGAENIKIQQNALKMS